MLPDYIHITTNAADSLKAFLDEHHFSQIFVLTDEHTGELCWPLIAAALPEQTVHVRVLSGEGNKNLATCSIIWDKLTAENADRRALLINLGGGVITDMGGFCASTYKRGIDFVNIPTTLLAQVDASIGGKLGIDFNGFKNQIGVFQTASKIIVDPIFLGTLPEEELKSGFAEVIKHNLIADQGLYKSLQQAKFSEIDWLKCIESSLKIKNSIVEADPREAGERKFLNFGHTIGHAVESFYLDTERHLRHGEAIAIGMIAEAYLSAKKLELPLAEVADLAGYIASIYQPAPIYTDDFEAIVRLTLQDKKNTGQQVNCVLLKSIGHPVYDVVIDEEEIIAALKYYNNQIK